MPECSKCKSAIRGESGVRCEGICKKEFHPTVKCCGVDQYNIKILDSNSFIRYMCDDCIQYVHNLDLVLAEVQEEVRKNKQHLIDYKDEFEESLKRNAVEMKKLLEAIEKRYELRMKKLDEVQKSYESNIKDIGKLCENVNDVKSKNNKLCSELREENEKMCNEIKKTIIDTNVNQNKPLYSELVKTGLPKINKQMPLIVKPKEKQGVDKTKQELNKKVDPVNLKITNVENRSNGTIIIRSENNEERDKIKSAIEVEMGENYEIKVATPFNLDVIVTDISYKYTEDEIMTKLRRQNPLIGEKDIKIISTFETKRNNRTIHNVKLNIDNETYENIMRAQRVNIGWERCRVFDGTSVKQCYKCRGYNHIATECKNQEICIKCHGNHKPNECNNEQMIKCINCIRENRRLNLGLDENHVTNDKKCPVYQNKLASKKKRLGLTQ